MLATIVPSLGKCNFKQPVPLAVFLTTGTPQQIGTTKVFVDQVWSLTAAPTGVPIPANAGVTSPFPANPPNPGWMTPPSPSILWIQPLPPAPSPQQPTTKGVPYSHLNGDYVYSAAFDVPDNPSHYAPIMIVGKCSADNAVTAIKLNTHKLPMIPPPTTPPDIYGFTKWVSFNSVGPQYFKKGKNTIEITVYNDQSWTGLLAVIAVVARCSKDNW